MASQPFAGVLVPLVSVLDPFSTKIDHCSQIQRIGYRTRLACWRSRLGFANFFFAFQMAR